MRIGTHTVTGKIFASVVLVGAAASVAGLGTFGSFTSSTSAVENVGSGTISLTAAGGAQGLSVDAEGLVPGDTVQRSIVLTRASGSEKFGSVQLTTTATGTGVAPLTTDVTNGLQLKLEQCSVAWTQVGATKALDCVGGTVTPVLTRPVIGAGLDLSAVTTALNSDAKVANLRATVTLPTAADNTFQGKSATMNFEFLATQRAAESR